MDDKVEAAHIDRNETDQVQREAIKHDEVRYQVRKSHPDEWKEVLDQLHIISDGWLSEKVIYNNILDKWWGVRFSPGKRPIYLAFAEIDEISRGISMRTNKNIAGFTDGPFFNLYQSTAPRSADKRVCFFLHRNMTALASGGERGATTNPNHFFAVLFDYELHSAFIYGAVSTPDPESVVESGSQSNWDRWFGPELWTDVARLLGWGRVAGDPFTTTVVSKNWHQVWDPFLSDERMVF